MSDRMGHKQTAAMFTLMALAREVSNPELREFVGFALDGKERTELNDLNLVKSRRQGRSFVHELTEQGWAWCGDELGQRTAPQPKPRSTLVPAMYMVFGRFADYFRQRSLPLAEVFVPGDRSVEVTAADVEDRIRAAYGELARSPRDWVGLVDLRQKLADLSRQDVDAALKKLSRNGIVHLVPESNRKTLTRADHDAAIRLGGEDNHLVSIEVS